MRGQVEFKKVDGDDPSNTSLKQKYSISGYPHLVFTDNTGRNLYDQGGAPHSAEEFKALIMKYK